MFEDQKAYKVIVSMVIEKALLNIGQAAYERVLLSLKEKYHCYFLDCYEHPEYLHQVLKELYGKSSNVIVESIKNDLEEWKEHQQIRKFLEVISQ